MIDVQVCPAPVPAGGSGLRRNAFPSAVAADVPAEFDVRLALDGLDRRPTVPERLTSVPVLDCHESEAIALVPVHAPRDPLHDAFSAVRFRVPPHRLGLSQDRQQRVDVSRREWAEAKSLGCDLDMQSETVLLCRSPGLPGNVSGTSVTKRHRRGRADHHALSMALERR
jgi:hypothetical protein